MVQEMNTDEKSPPPHGNPSDEIEESIIEEDIPNQYADEPKGADAW